MADVCPCHGEPWIIDKVACPSRIASGRGPLRRCPVKRAAVRIGADARYVAADPARRLEQTRSASRVYQARRRSSARLVRENRTKKLGKLLNLSVHGATEHERLLARQKYNLLKKGTHA